MLNPLPKLDLAFGDFTLLAILLAIMYSITAFEVWFTPEGKASAGIRLIDRSRAATWAFFGIFLTLLAGVFAGSEETDYDIAVLLIPLAFIVRWAYFHYRTSQQLLNTQVMIDYLDRTYKDAVQKFLKEGQQSGYSVMEIHNGVAETNIYANLITQGGPLVKAIVPIPLGDIVTQFLPTIDRTTKVLQELENENIVKEFKGNYIFLKV